MKTLITHTYAAKMLDLLEQHILAGGGPISGYTKIAEDIGWKGGSDFGQAVGQVTSLLDYACFIARLPALPAWYVRQADGSVNPNMWGQDAWLPHENTIMDAAARHQWAKEDFAKVRKMLHGLPNCGAQALWRSASERGTAWVEYQLNKAQENFRPMTT
jgi:hypothetical protein